MTDRELMQEALYALTYVGDAKEIYSDTIESLRARLTQPEQEPIKYEEWNYDPMTGKPLWGEQPEPEPVADKRLKIKLGSQYGGDLCGQWFYLTPADDNANTALTAHTGIATPPQREWQGLTEDDIREFEIWLDDEEERRGWNPPEDIAKYLEAKLREKNT